MAIRIRFDKSHNALQPALVLMTRSGRALGDVPCSNVQFKDNLNSYSELSFSVNKTDCYDKAGGTFGIWDKLKDFKLVWAREWNALFEIYVESEEADGISKNIQARSLGEAELSQINLYNIEINTETDIMRDDYKPTVLFNKDDPSVSLLNRITEKAQHYKINYVDENISGIQRTFSFNDKTIYDAFQEISEEIDCLFVIECRIGGDGRIIREINVYDLETNCNECGYRGEFLDVCPECGSKNIKYGFGEDTTIFVTTENLADNITFDTDEGSVKNCFRLEAGDDLMTATVANCNPNGGAYIWYISDDVKEDMSKELVTRLNDYDKLYKYYQEEHEVVINGELLEKYNSLVDKYSAFDKRFQKITSPIVGYADLMKEYYNAIDFYLYINNELMPTSGMSDTTAEKEAGRLNSESLSPVAVQNLESCSAATASNAALAMAKAIVDNRYQTKVKDSAFSENIWSGSFTITNYSDEEDTFTTPIIQIEITDDYETFVRQKIEKALGKKKSYDMDITGLFSMPDEDFKSELKKYGLSRLSSFYDCGQSCIDILIEQGIADRETWADNHPDMYTELYLPYYNKLLYIQEEMAIRENEISIITGKYDKDGDLIADGISTILEDERDDIHKNLDFENYIGEELWLEFASYRREDTYKNENYISDGLNNNELIEQALSFIRVARNEIYKSATMQHSISTSLKNLLVMKEFEPIEDYFEVGNWIRIKTDGKIYKLRLLGYEISFENFNTLSVVFSDVKYINDGGISDLESIKKQAESMASSYGSVSRQANKGKASNDTLEGWVDKGLSLTNMKIIDSAENQNITWDSHGFLFTEYLPLTDEYDDKQLKIINKGLYVTDDNWKTSKAGIGNFIFYNPETMQMEEGYGVIADKLVGNLILSEKVGIYNTSNSITLDENGVTITTDGVSGDNKTVFTIQKKGEDGGLVPMTYIDSDGNYVINGSIKVFTSSSETNSLVGMLDSKTETWYQAEDPSEEWTDEEKEEHIGDLWYNTTDEKTYVYNGASWQETKTSPPKEFFDAIDGKAQIFTSQPVPPYKVGDLWAQGDNGDIMICRTARETGSFSADDWEKACKYADQNDIDSSCEDLGRKLNETISSQAAEQRQYADNAINNYKSELGQYMTYDENGLTLGAVGSSFKTVIDNRRLAFCENNSVAAYISNSQLYIPNAVIQNALLLGDFAFVPRNDGGVSLVWQG